MRILWLGGVFSEHILKKYNAVNQAANRWSNGLLNALQEIGCEIFIIAHRPEQSWPKGKLFPGKDDELHSAFKGKVISYLNYNKLRSRSLLRQYNKALNLIVPKFKPDIIMCYNPYIWNIQPMQNVSNKYNIPWVPVLLDYADPGAEWSLFKQTIANADGYVLLSYWGYENCPTTKPKLHLDGGNTDWYGDSIRSVKTGKKIILYAGKYNEYGGLKILLDIAEYVERSNSFKILFCGKGCEAILKNRKNTEDKIEVLGFLSESELHEQHLKADLFLNVRPPEISDNLMTFPSKIVNYLSYGKPIISNWTEGLSPEYKKLLIFPNKYDGEGFIKKIEEVGKWSEEDFLMWRNKIYPWFKSHTWKAQAERIHDWLESVIHRNML